MVLGKIEKRPTLRPDRCEECDAYEATLDQLNDAFLQIRDNAKTLELVQDICNAVLEDWHPSTHPNYVAPLVETTVLEEVRSRLLEEGIHSENSILSLLYFIDGKLQESAAAESEARQRRNARAEAARD